MKKKLLAVAMGAMLAAGAANALTVNSAGLGDLLVAPLHLSGGIQAQLTVVFAPPQNEPVMASVVVRDIERSPDCLDFTAYLSPGGVSVSTLKAVAVAADGHQLVRPALPRT